MPYPKIEVPYVPEGEYLKWRMYERLKRKAALECETSAQYREACKHISDQLGL